MLANTVFAQVPNGIPYQAVARNSSGVILANQKIRVRFSIHDNTAGGTVVYQETFNPTTTALGLFNVNVGTGTVASGTFSGINWGTNAKYMQVELDPTGGTSYVDMGTQQMMSVPYAFYSGNGMPAGNTGDILYNNGSGWVQLSAGSDGQLLTMKSGFPQWTSLIITTTAVTDVNSYNAKSGGNIISGVNVIVSAKGVCWSVSPGPTISDQHTLDGFGATSFVSNFQSVTNLLPSTTYYVRAYVTIGGVTTYGNEISFSTMPAPGSAYAGGILVTLFTSGNPRYDPYVPHGLIVAPTDQSTGIQWYNGSYTLTGATNYYDGMINTNAIIASQGAGSYAAQLCKTLNIGGYTDWCLPTDNDMYYIIDYGTPYGGVSPSVNYWTSSEASSTTAISWHGYSRNYPDKSSPCYVRAVRYF